MSANRWLAPRLALLAIVACANVLGPDAISDAVPFHPPARYRTLWDEVETCAGREADFDRIRWYVVEGKGSFHYQGRSNLAYWWPTHEIVVAGYQSDNGRTVRHEMLHDILQSGDHPAEYFVTRCGAIIR